MTYFLSWVEDLCGVFFVSLTLLTSPLCHASDGFYSEMSHAIGGAAMASFITHKYSDSEYRSWIGFGLSTAIIVVAQNYEISKSGKRSSQQLDMVAHALGSALGAWYTDKYVLVPLVQKNYIGLTLHIPVN
ncbi:MAG: hypothetical protein RIT13_252 [Pseudomonadota bacterium]|jgi:hypothetical protein